MKSVEANTYIFSGDSERAQRIVSDVAPKEKRRGTVRVQTVSPQQLDATAFQFADIIPEQTGAFNVGHWGTDNIECVKFYDGNAEIGCACLIVRKVPFSATGIAILKWGPVWRHKSSDIEPSLYQKVVQSLIEEFCTRRNLHLTIMPLAARDTGEMCSRELLKMGFTKGAELPAPQRYLVDTGQASDTLMNSFEQKWRYNLRKAMKNDFEIKILEPDSGLPMFLDLYKKMMERKKFDDSSAVGSLESFVRTAPHSLKPIIVIVFHEGRPTAGGVFFTAGDMASYMFGATDDRALKLKAGYALHWWVAEFLCNQKQNKWYDLGGNDRDAGLHQFKRGMVGKSGHIIISPARFHYAPSAYVSFVGRSVFLARDILSDLKRFSHYAKGWIRR